MGSETMGRGGAVEGAARGCGAMTPELTPDEIRVLKFARDGIPMDDLGLMPADWAAVMSLHRRGLLKLSFVLSERGQRALGEY